MGGGGGGGGVLISQERLLGNYFPLKLCRLLLVYKLLGAEAAPCSSPPVCYGSVLVSALKRGCHLPENILKFNVLGGGGSECLSLGTWAQAKTTLRFSPRSETSIVRTRHRNLCTNMP
jgi:hypothetical protein